MNCNEQNNNQTQLTHKNIILELFKSMRGISRAELQSRAKYIEKLLCFTENLFVLKRKFNVASWLFSAR